MLFSRSRLLFGAAFFLGVASCLNGCTPGSSTGEQQQTPAGHLLELLPELANAASLGEWREEHPGDSITPYDPRLAESTYEEWCVRAEAEAPLDSLRTFWRAAYFYPPETPVPPVLPTGVPAGELVDGCRLGFVWIEVVDAGADSASALAEETRRSIAAVLGPAEDTTRLFWAGSALWREGVLWRRGPSTVVTALTNYRSWTRTIEPPGAARLFIAAAGAASGISFEWERRRARTSGIDRGRPPWVLLRPRIDEMIALAGIGPDAAGPFRASLSLVDDLMPLPRFLTDEERLALVNAIGGWLVAAEDAPPQRRAAALVAADLLLGVSWHSARLGDPELPSLRERLAEHGVEFDFSPLGRAYAFTHGWLKEALRIDADGPAGDAALLSLMEMGFETAVGCREQGGVGFRAVIQRGEEHLRDRPGSAIEPEVRFLVAEAYSDIVTLANGGAYQESETSQYVAEAPGARRRAIQEYEVAFSLASGSSRAGSSWANAWRLMAGLTPTRTFFYCVYD